MSGREVGLGAGGILESVGRGVLRAADPAARLPPGLRVLLAEASGNGQGLAQALTLRGARVQLVTKMAALGAELARSDADLVVAATSLPDGQLVDVLDELRRPLVAIADTLEQEMLTALVRSRWLLDVLYRPVSAKLLVAAVSGAWQEAQAPAAEPARLRPDPARRPLHAIRGEASGDPGLLERLGSVGAAIARTRLPVLIVGETGTGKSRLAKKLHETLSPRTPFVEVNAASLCGALFDSELFGHERGAFTGAHVAKPGLVALARGGTLFLDEIGELSLDSQAHLLSFLDSGTFRPVGALKDQRSDARIVCATNQPLELAIQERRFRQDLYYRLAGLVVPLPPLRARVGEIAPLARGLLDEAAERVGVTAPRLRPDAEGALRDHGWPGNVRQLRWVMERLASHFGGAEVGGREVQFLLDTPRPTPGGTAFDEVLPLAEVERKMVCLAMERSQGNRTRAAQMLGITPRGLYNKLRRIRWAGGDPAADLGAPVGTL